MDIEIRNENHEPVGGDSEYGWKAVLRVELSEDNDATIEVVEVHDSENGVPMDVWHRKVLRWGSRVGSGVVSLPQLEKLKERIAPLLQIIAESREVVWDGNNHVGRLVTEEAREADAEIEHIVADCEWQDDQWSLWDATDWVRANWRDTAKDLGLTAASDNDVMACVKAEGLLHEWAALDNVALSNTGDAVAWMIQKLQDQED